MVNSPLLIASGSAAFVACAVYLENYLGNYCIMGGWASVTLLANDLHLEDVSWGEGQFHGLD